MGKKVVSLVFALWLLVSTSGFAFATDSNTQVLKDQDFTATELSRFEVDLPHDLDPGYHELVVQVYNDSGVLEDRILPFCKAIDGRAHWNNVCEGLDAFATEKQLDQITVKADLPKYLAPMEPKKQINTLIVALVTLTLILGRRNSLKHPDLHLHTPPESTQGSLEEVQNSDLDGVKVLEKWGDRSWTYRLLPGYKKVDEFFDKGPLAIDRWSPLMARAMCDGDYLRAIIGTLTLFVYGFAAVGAVVASAGVHHQALPPSWQWCIILALLGVLDSFAGIVAAIFYFLTTVITGNVHSISDLLTLVGVSTLFFGPALIACAVRPFRRETEGGDDRWELVTDLALAPLMGGWAAQKIVNGLPGFAKAQLPVAFHANQIGIIIGLSILVRILIEDGSLRLYPRRINDVCSDLEEPYAIQKFVSGVLKTLAFYYIGGLFIGFNKFTLIGTLFFAIPQFIKVFFEDRLPQSKRLYRILPTGTILAIVLTMLGIAISNYVITFFTSTIAYFKWTYVAVAATVSIFALADLFITEPDGPHWRIRSKWQTGLWRVGGSAIYALLVLIVLNVDVVGKIHDLFFR